MPIWRGPSAANSSRRLPRQHKTSSSCSLPSFAYCGERNISTIPQRDPRDPSPRRRKAAKSRSVSSCRMYSGLYRFVRRFSHLPFFHDTPLHCFFPSTWASLVVLDWEDHWPCFTVDTIPTSYVHVYIYSYPLLTCTDIALSFLFACTPRMPVVVLSHCVGFAKSSASRAATDT